METLINSIPWSDYETASSNASVIPALLKKLSSKSDNQRRQALFDLRNEVAHQGHIYLPIAAVITPVILELIKKDGHPLRAELIQLLADLAAGGSHSEWISSEFSNPPCDDIIILLSSEMELWTSLLGEQDLSVVSASTLVFSVLSNLQKTHHEKLIELLARSNEISRVSSQFALTILHQRKIITHLPPINFSNSHPQLIAFLAHRTIRQEILLDDDFLYLLELANNQNIIEHLYWFDGKLDQFAIELLVKSALKQNQLDMIWLLLDDRPSAEGKNSIASKILQQCLSLQTADTLRTKEDLTTTEINILTNLINRKLISYESGSRLLKAGLFTDASSLYCLLSGKIKTDIDTIINGKPLWFWCNQVINRRLPEEEFIGLIASITKDEFRITQILKHLVAIYPVAQKWPADKVNIFHNELILLISRVATQFISTETIVTEINQPTWPKAEGLFYPRAMTPWETSLIITLSNHDISRITQNEQIRQKLLKLLGQLNPAPGLEKVLTAMNIDERWNLVQQLTFTQGYDSTTKTTYHRGAWNWLHLCPTLPAAHRFLEQVASCKINELPQEPLDKILQAVKNQFPDEINQWLANITPELKQIVLKFE
jgi:hypothetical protein